MGVPPPQSWERLWQGRAFACIFFVSDNHSHLSLTATGRPLAATTKKDVGSIPYAAKPHSKRISATKSRVSDFIAKQ
ncbi:MAG: hypothetical protein LBQ31_06550 [Bacteroidales bacterium]|nr:hypothetical protein [Bacteroidales bacterium]